MAVGVPIRVLESRELRQKVSGIPKPSNSDTPKPNPIPKPPEALKPYTLNPTPPKP